MKKLTLVKRYWKLWKTQTLLHRFTFYFLFILGFGLRLGYLFQPVRNNEAYSYLAFSSNSLKVVMTSYNHIFHNILTYFTTRIFGNNVVALRLPVFLCGLLVIPLTYLVVRKLAKNHNAALLAMAMVAISSGLVGYSTQAEGYMVQAALLLGLVLVGIHLINTDSIGGWVGFTILAVLGLFTIPTFVYFFPPVMIWVFLSRFFGHYDRPRLVKRSLVSLAGVVALTLLLYAPALSVSGAGALRGDPRFKGGVIALPWSTFMRGLPTNVNSIWSMTGVGIPGVFVVILLAGVVVTTLLYKRVIKTGTNLALILLLWIVIVYLALRQLAFPGTFVPIIPLYMGFASIGVYAVWKLVVSWVRRVMPARLLSPLMYAVAAFLLITLVYSMVFVAQGPYQLDVNGRIMEGTMRDASAITRVLKKELRPGDMVISMAGLGTVPLEYYFRQNRIPLNFLSGTVAQMKDWANGNYFRYMNDQFNAMTRNKIKRAILVSDEREGQSLFKVTQYAVVFMGFDSQNFGGKPTLLHETDWSMVQAIQRQGTTPITRKDFLPAKVEQ